MIRAGKLDRQITIERASEIVLASGTTKRTWAPVATVRAELVQLSAEEYLTGFGESDSGSAVFRIRYMSGFTTADRVTLDRITYEIDEIAELGRKRSLELRCSVVAA